MVLSLFCLQSVVAVCCVIGSGESIKDRELGSSHTRGIITGWLVSSCSLLSLSLSPPCEPRLYINAHSMCGIGSQPRIKKKLSSGFLALLPVPSPGPGFKQLCLVDRKHVQPLFTYVCVLTYTSSSSKNTRDCSLGFFATSSTAIINLTSSHRYFITVPISHFSFFFLFHSALISHICMSFLGHNDTLSQAAAQFKLITL